MKLVNVVESSGPSRKAVLSSGNPNPPVIHLNFLCLFHVEAPIQAHLSDGMSLKVEWYDDIRNKHAVSLSLLTNCRTSDFQNIMQTVRKLC